MGRWWGQNDDPVIADTDHEKELERNKLLAEITLLRTEINDMCGELDATKDPRFTRVPVKLTMPMRQAILAYTGKCLRDKLRINADTLYRELLEAWTTSQKDDAEHGPLSPTKTQ